MIRAKNRIMSALALERGFFILEDLPAQPTAQPVSAIAERLSLPINSTLRLIEVNRRGEVMREVKLATTEKKPHAQFRMCRKTRNDVDQR